MAAGFRMVSWNAYKRAFDGMLALGLALFFTAHIGAGLMAAPAGQGARPGHGRHRRSAASPSSRGRL